MWETLKSLNRKTKACLVFYSTVGQGRDLYTQKEIPNDKDSPSSPKFLSGFSVNCIKVDIIKGEIFLHALTLVSSPSCCSTLLTLQL